MTGMEVDDIMMAMTKNHLVVMARSLSVSAEIHPRDRKSKIVADLSEVLTTSDVLDWAEMAGIRVTIS